MNKLSILLTKIKSLLMILTLKQLKKPKILSKTLKIISKKNKDEIIDLQVIYKIKR